VRCTIDGSDPQKVNFSDKYGSDADRGAAHAFAMPAANLAAAQAINQSLRRRPWPTIASLRQSTLHCGRRGQKR